MKKNWKSFVLVILIFVLGFSGGVFYCTYLKTKNISSSALNAAKNSQSFITPTPTASSSAVAKPVSNLKIPDIDVEGADLADVPRYPGSIRSIYEKSTDGTQVLIEYYAKESSSKIWEYYKNTLKDTWTLMSADKQTLTFSKNGAELSIEIIDEDKTPITQYQISYTKVEAQPAE